MDFSIGFLIIVENNLWKYLELELKGSPKNENPVINYSPLCHSKPKLGYFWWNPRAFWPCIDRAKYCELILLFSHTGFCLLYTGKYAYPDILCMFPEKWTHDVFCKTNGCYPVFLLSTALKPALYFLLELVMMCLWIYVTTCAILIDRSIDFLDFTLVKSH